MGNITPSDDASAVNVPASVKLDPGERGRLEFQTDRKDSLAYLETVAITDQSETNYVIRIDDDIRHSAKFPPSTMAEKARVWAPPEQVDQTLIVEILDRRGSGGTRQYDVAPIGWEESK